MAKIRNCCSAYMGDFYHSGGTAGIADLRNWQYIDGEHGDAPIQILYENNTNHVTITPSGGFERLLFMATVKPGLRYRFSFVMESKETLSYYSEKQYEYAFATDAISGYGNFLISYDEDFCYNAFGGLAKTNNFVNSPNTPTVYSCEFETRTNERLAYLWIEFGALEDLLTYHFKFSDITFEEVTI